MWKDEFIELLFPEKASEINLSRAHSIKISNIPPYLYKYRCATDYAFENLSTNTMWCSSPKKLNDPIDSSSTFNPDYMLPAALEFSKSSFSEQYDLNNEFTDDEISLLAKSGNFVDALIDLAIQKKLEGWKSIAVRPFRKILKKVVGKIYSELINHFAEKFRSSLKIISLSETYLNDLMWSHYCDGHRGFCIEYDFSAIPRNDIFLRGIFPVIYRTKLPDITRYLTKLKDFNIYFPIYSSIIKNSRWAYEKEWRIIFPFGLLPQEQNIIMPPISRVIIGYKAEKETIQRIEEISKIMGFKIEKLGINAANGKLEIQTNGA